MTKNDPSRRSVPGAICILAGLATLTVALAWFSTRAQALPLAQTASDGEVIFKQKCAGCHTIGAGRLVGPDLKGVTQGQSLDWLKGFISAPDKVIASGDPTAKQLLAEYNNLPMPNLGLSSSQVDALLAYLEAPSNGASQPGAAAPQAAPSGNAQTGRELFTGTRRLSAQGIPCIACHSVANLPALRGGGLGPDLTHVIRRYGGSTGLASTLNSLPFPTMQGIFATRRLTSAEQADLLAFLSQADQAPAQISNTPMFLLASLGIGGSLILFGLLAIFWPRQRQSRSEILRRSAGLHSTRQ
jgi:mono/diheme cytochrome c family protein